MLKTLQSVKIDLMKKRRQDKTNEHDYTVKINGLNDVLTEIKTKAVKQKTTIEELDEKTLVDVLNLVMKRLDKEIEAYGDEHPKAKDAKTLQDYLDTFIPDAYREATPDIMDEFIANEKAQGHDFKTIMQNAKTHINFNMKYISQHAK